MKTKTKIKIIHFVEKLLKLSEPVQLPSNKVDNNILNLKVDFYINREKLNLTGDLFDKIIKQQISEGIAYELLKMDIINYTIKPEFQNDSIKNNTHYLVESNLLILVPTNNLTSSPQSSSFPKK